MKKLFALILALWMVVCVFSVGASAADDDGWSTYTGTIGDSALTFTLKAKGNEIKIEITGDAINGDKLACPGTKGFEDHELWGKADGRDLSVSFRDGRVEDGENELNFSIQHACGEDAEPHTVSLKQDVTFSVKYCFYAEDNERGVYTHYVGSVAPGYSGRWGTEECRNLHLNISGHTLTMTTTLPDQVVDFRNEDARDLRLKSDSLWVSGSWTAYYYTSEPQPTDPPEKQNLIRRTIQRIREVFEKFIALFRKLFGIQEAKQPEKEKLYYDYADNTVSMRRIA